MSILTDIVVANTEEASAVAEANVPSREWEGIDSKGIEHAKLAHLASILRREPYDPDFITQIQQLAEGSEEGPWVFALPQDFVRNIAALDEGRIPEVALDWSKAEEFALDGWEPKAVESFLFQLHRIAASACLTDKSLLMWMSL